MYNCTCIIDRKYINNKQPYFLDSLIFIASGPSKSFPNSLNSTTIPGSRFISGLGGAATGFICFGLAAIFFVGFFYVINNKTSDGFHSTPYCILTNRTVIN